MVPLKLKFDDDFLAEESKELMVSKDTKKVWAVQLDLLSEFGHVCERMGLKWYADAGTLLGAVRHKGFIPWDDDIDVCMPRADYVQLCSRAAAELRQPYFLQTYETDAGFAWGHAVLRNSDTAEIPKADLQNGYSVRTYNQGISLDIFPMDNIPDDASEADDFLSGVESRLDAMRSMGALLRWRKTFTWRGMMSCHGMRMALKYMMSVLRYRCSCVRALYLLAQDHDSYTQKYNGRQTALCSPISYWPHRKKSQYYRVEWFKDTVFLDFEMLKVPVPAGYGELLNGLYGDWHRHVIGGAEHGAKLFDVDKSYLNYQRS